MVHTKDSIRFIVGCVGLLFVFVILTTLAIVLGGWLFLAAAIIVWSLFLAVVWVTLTMSVLMGAPFLPTDRRNVEAMIQLAEVKAGERVYDLGSGDGRILIAAAKAGAFAEGWEINPLLWAISQWRVLRAGVHDRVKVHLGSYWSVSMQNADVVTLFLITSKMAAMEKKLKQELPSGARVVSYIFTFPTWNIAAEAGTGVRLYRV